MKKELPAEQRVKIEQTILKSLKGLFTDIHVKAWLNTVDIKVYPSGYVHIRSSWAGVSREAYRGIIIPWMKENGYKWDASGRNYPEFPHWGKQI